MSKPGQESGRRIPMVVTFITLGMPVAIVFIVKYFALKHRELDLDAEHQK